MSWEIAQTGRVHHGPTFDSECGAIRESYSDWPPPKGSGWEPFAQEGGIMYWRRNTDATTPDDGRLQRIERAAFTLLKALGMGPELSPGVRKAVLDLYGAL